MYLENELLFPLGSTPIRGTTAAGKIVEQVRAALLGNLLRPGDSLGTEGTFAQRFGVSRSVSRDALKALEAIGIIEIRKGSTGGIRIAAGNPACFADALAIQLKLINISENELVDAQLAIECNAAEAAARQLADEDKNILERLLVQAEQCLDDPSRSKSLCFEFHRAVTASSKNRILITLFDSLEYVRDAAYAQFPSRERAQVVFEEHKALYTALVNGDPGAARALMVAHLERLRETLHAKGAAPKQDRNFKNAIERRE